MKFKLFNRALCMTSSETCPEHTEFVDTFPLGRNLSRLGLKMCGLIFNPLIYRPSTTFKLCNYVLYDVLLLKSLESGL